MPCYDQSPLQRWFTNLISFIGHGMFVIAAHLWYCNTKHPKRYLSKRMCLSPYLFLSSGMSQDHPVILLSNPAIWGCGSLSALNGVSAPLTSPTLHWKRKGKSLHPWRLPSLDNPYSHKCGILSPEPCHSQFLQHLENSNLTVVVFVCLFLQSKNSYATQRLQRNKEIIVICLCKCNNFYICIFCVLL